MLASWRESRYPVELGLLLGVCFFLPLLEAPKNLLWLAYIAAWLVNRARARDFGGRWDGWDTLIGAWIASGFLAAAFAGLQGSEWKGAGDLVRYGSVLWCVKRARYGERELRWILGTLVASVVVGLAAGYFRMWTGIGKSGTLQLHSVGHVNHTAIYIAITLGACASWIFARWRTWRAGIRAVALAVAALLLVSLMVTASRGAIGAGLFTMLALAAAWWRRSRAPMAISAALVIVVAVIALAAGAEVVRRQIDYVSSDNVLSYRDGIWRAALTAWRKHPVFGVGMDNYSRITPERVRTWDEEAGRPHEPSRYYHSAHAHSLYVNTLAERGLVGAAALGAVLIAWPVFLLRRRPGAQDGDQAWLLWGAAAAAWLVSAGVGLVNTTLHHEHGLLAALLLGLWLSSLRRAS